MTFRIVVVGAGVMGRNHARVVRELGRETEVQLAGVVDADAAVAGSVAQAHGAKPRALDEVLKDPTVDAVVVATPTSTHHGVSRRALEAGKHVLVEKPIAPSLDEALDLVSRARKAGRTLAVGHIERHNPAVRYAHDALAKGEFGKLITVTSRRVSNLPGRIRDVGCILDLGIHDLDAVRYLVGKDPARVAADAGTFTPGIAFEDHATILLSFPGGASGLVEVNWLTPMKVRRLAITASEAYAELDYIAQTVRVSTSRISALNEANLFQVPLELSERTVELRRQEPLRLEMLDFVEASRTGKSPLVTGEDGVAVLRIAQAASKSAETKATVTL